MAPVIATQSSVLEGHLIKISTNFTNNHKIPPVAGDSQTQGNIFRAGSKCALLNTMEDAQYKFTPVQTKIYTGSKWTPLTENEILLQMDELECNNSDSDLLQNVTVLSWDVSCREEFRPGFYNEILAVVCRILPDFCCFQNAQHDFRAWVKNCETIREHYYLSNSNLDYIDFESDAHNGLLTLSRWPGEYVEYPFIDTQVGGYLLACQTVINGIPVVTANSKHQILGRGMTIKYANDILSAHGNVIWLGNFGSVPNDSEEDMPGITSTELDTSVRDMISSYQDMEEIAEGKHSDKDKMLVRSDRMKPAHYFTLDIESSENRPGVVGVIQLK